MKLYRDRFNHIREGQFIYSNGDIDPFVFTRKRLRWRCLYSQKHKSRNKLPKYLFISDKGNVISVFGEVPAHITQYLNNDKYARIGSGNGNSYGVGKPLYIHILVAIVYGSPMTPRARKLLAEKGYDAFGVDDTHNCLTSESCPESFPYFNIDTLECVKDCNINDNCIKCNKNYLSHKIDHHYLEKKYMNLYKY